VGLRDALLLLVRWRLAGYSYRLTAAYQYFVENRSPSELAKEYRVTRNALVGYLARLALANGDYISQRYAGIGRLLRAVYPVLCEVEPVFTAVDGVYICTLCGKRVRSSPLAHLEREHRREVEKVGRYVVKLSRNPQLWNRRPEARIQSSRPVSP